MQPSYCPVFDLRSACTAQASGVRRLAAFCEFRRYDTKTTRFGPAGAAAYPAL